MGGFCRPESMGIKNVMFQMGGEAGKIYDVKLKVTAILEGIAYAGGMPVGDHFYIGGRGTTANYGSLRAGGRVATYFINRHAGRRRQHPQVRVHDAGDQDPGRSLVALFCRDTNNHLTMNSERGKHVIAMPPPSWPPRSACSRSRVTSST